jgi:DNA uptake protein ComE-like DNA-binding protein
VLTIWFYWFPFVYTGLRVMHPRWIAWGVAYGTPAFLLALMSPDHPELAGQLRGAMFVFLLVSMVHAWFARHEFLERLVDIEDEREALRERTRKRRLAAEGQQSQPAHQPQLAQAAKPAPAPQFPQFSKPSRQPQASQLPVEPEPAEDEEIVMEEAPAAARMLFDPNNMSERDFALLPGIGPKQAREAVGLREQIGGYKSFEHFAEKMSLAPQARARLRPLFIEAPPPEHAKDSEYRQQLDGRYVLDINLVSVEAIATLPGISHDLARKAVQMRGTDGPFTSVEDFRYRLGLTIDQFVPLHGIISTSRTAAKPVDPKFKPSGRIVDV